MNRQSVPPDRQLSSDVEVAGFVVVGYLQSAEGTSPIFADRFEKQLAACGITNPQMGEWYSATALQAALFETSEVVGEPALVDAGAEMARVSDWSDDIHTVPDALVGMRETHSTAHRKTESTDIGGYELEQVEDSRAVIDCRNFPYPTSVGQGAIRGTVELFANNPDTVTISKQSSNKQTEARTDTDDSTPTLRFEVSW